MFDFLKKKIGGFIDGLTKKEEEKAEKIKEVEVPEVEAPEVEEIKLEEKPVPEKKERKAPQKEEKRKGPVPKEERKEKEEKKPEARKQEKQIEKEAPEKPEPVAAQKQPAPAAPSAPRQLPQTIPPRIEGMVEAPTPEKKEKERIKLGALSAIKSIITREVEISEGDVKDLLESFELELLEADVDISVAESLREELRGRLIGARTSKKELHHFISGVIRKALVETITNKNAFDMVERVGRLEKPVKMMFFGINGAGKTTTIAKVARLLMDNGYKVVFAAADTFRAAAIEQMAVHADRLDVRMIKRDYGSDPTSVAYDAVNYAKAHGIDAVLIDTAGRQDTNISLINEMKKMDRVIKPDLKLYIGESIAGNAIIEQISSFNREIGIDGVILTKLDCDPKGGTMLSINKATGIPVIYVGIGQGYGDLERFDAEKIVGRIVA